MSTNLRETFREIVNGPSSTTYLVSAWQHLVGHEYGAETFANAYVQFVKKWDWQWVKINPRAIYYSEAWGSRYDHDDYQGSVIPKKLHDVIAKPEDIEAVTTLDPKNNAILSEVFEASRIIRDNLEDRAVLQTVFSPLSVLLQLADLPLYPHDDYATPTTSVQNLIFDQPEKAGRSLQAITDTLIAFVRSLVRSKAQGGAGLDGIFYAVTGTVSEDYFDKEQYARFGWPYDQQVIAAIHDENPEAVVLLHTCRADSYPDYFDVKGVDLLQWDQYLPGNPKADADVKATPVVGPNWNLFFPEADTTRVTDEIKESIRLRGDRPFLLAPSCTVPTPADEAALRALSAARL